MSQRWPFVIIAAAALILFAPFAAGAQMFYWGTPLLQFYPWRLAALDAVRAGCLPLWNPLLGNGAPLLANYQSALLYPPNWLGLILPLDLALNWLLIAHVIWAGGGMAALARALGYRPFGQTVAGLAFGLSQYVVARAGFYSINAAVAWMPWVVWAGEALVQGLRSKGEKGQGGKGETSQRQWMLPAVLRLTTVVSLQLLAGHAQTTWYTLLLLTGWILWRFFFDFGRRRPWPLSLNPSTLLLLPLAFSLAALIASAQLLPTAELLRQSPRAEAAGYEFVMTYSFSPWRLLTFLAPDLLGNPARGKFYGYGNYLEDAVYVGVLPLLWGLGAACASWRRRSQMPARVRWTLFLALLLPATLLLALGRNTPVFPWLYAHVPTFNLFQAPTRMMVWAVFALALLGGWGADRWRGRLRGRALYWTNLGAAGAVSIILTAGAALVFIQPASTVLRQLLTVAGAVLAAGVNLFAFAALSLLRGRLPRRRWELLAALCLAGDLIVANWGINPGAPADLYRAVTQSGPALARALAGARLYQYPGDEYAVKFSPYFSFETYGAADLAPAAREAQLADSALLEGLASANNFEPLLSARYAAFMDVVSQTRSTALLNLMDVGAVASRAPLAWPVLAAGSDVSFYRPPGEPRRIWVFYDSQPAADLAAAQTALAAPGFDPARTVILEPAGGAPPADPAPAGVDPRDPNAAAFSVTLERAGWVLVSDTYYPGWRAWVDGVPAAIQPADAAFRAVAVPAGAHSVVFQYAPETWRWGLWLSGLGLLLAAGLWVGARR